MRVQRVDLDGPAAIEFLFATHVVELAKHWDGGCELVGHILLEEGVPPRVGFWSRERTAEELRRRAERSPDPQTLRKIATSIVEDPEVGKVQCILLAGPVAVLAGVPPEDLRNLDRDGVNISGDDLVGTLERCKTSEGAAAAIGEVRLLYLAETGKAPETLAELEQVLADRWDDLGAVQDAINRAREASNEELPTSAGHRARFVLLMLTQAVFNQATVDVNARGGTA